MLFKLLFATATAIFMLVIALVGFQTPVGLLIKYGISALPFGDKAIHFGLMMTLSYLFYHALNQRRVNILGHELLFSSLLLTICITLEECSQLFISSRNFEMMDLVCNYAGIYFGTLLPKLINLKHMTYADHFRGEALPVQAIQPFARPMFHESGNGRHTFRRLVRHHGRR